MMSKDTGTSYDTPNGGWRVQAACAGADPDLFGLRTNAELRKYGYRAEAHPKVDAALSYCERCPVRKQCLDEALNETDFAAVGVRGGQYLSWGRASKNLSSARRRLGISGQHREYTRDF